MYIVIELFGGPLYASIVMDEYGNKVFEDVEDAQKEADDWQDAIVVKVRG